MALFLLGTSSSYGLQPGTPPTKVPTSSTSSPDSTRRFTFLAVPAIALASVASPSPSVALDMDSFIAKELDVKKEPPKMGDDEALCKFGAPSKKTGEACLRAGLSTKRPTGVDAFGTVDRGDFVRCKPYYVDDPNNKGQLKNVWDCK